MKNISQSKLMGLKTLLPPLSEQRRIADILDRAEALRAKRLATLAQLEELTNSFFEEMCADITTEVQQFSSLAHFQEGPGVRNWQFRDSGIKLINVVNMVNGELELSRSSRYLDESEVVERYSHFLLNVGDFVLASSGVTWGKIAEVRELHLPLCLNTSVIRVRPKDPGLMKPYLRSWLSSSKFKGQIERLITGSAQPNFGPAHLKQLVIQVPPLALQQEFARRVQAIDRLKAKHRQSLAEMDALFLSLQHRAFRGEL